MSTQMNILAVARAEALFTSDLPAGATPSRAEATRSIRRTIHDHGGVRGCAAQLAGEYGEHPETAAARMRWARSVVDLLYARSPAADRTRFARHPK